jgi:hypothetical protein
MSIQACQRTKIYLFIAVVYFGSVNSSNVFARKFILDLTNQGTWYWQCVYPSDGGYGGGFSDSRRDARREARAFCPSSGIPVGHVDDFSDFEPPPDGGYGPVFDAGIFTGTKTISVYGDQQFLVPADVDETASRYLFGLDPGDSLTDEQKVSAMLKSLGIFRGGSTREEISLLHNLDSQEYESAANLRLRRAIVDINDQSGQLDWEFKYVPEPSALCLCACSGLVVLLLRTRHRKGR